MFILQFRRNSGKRLSFSAGLFIIVFDCMELYGSKFK